MRFFCCRFASSGQGFEFTVFNLAQCKVLYLAKHNCQQENSDSCEGPSPVSRTLPDQATCSAHQRHRFDQSKHTLTCCQRQLLRRPGSDLNQQCLSVLHKGIQQDPVARQIM